MADHFLDSRVWLARSRPDVFALLADPRNAVQLTPPALRLQLLTPAPGPLKAGSVLDFRLRWLGLPLSWRAYIREYDEPYRFVDVQVRGPWARWEHRHQFLEENGGTWVEDRVTYRLPLGPLGRVLNGVLVRRQLHAVWSFRNDRLTELLRHPTPPATNSPPHHPRIRGAPRGK
jgi:ligand-binding SRPBCC domain-containing protein